MALKPEIRYPNTAEGAGAESQASATVAMMAMLPPPISAPWSHGPAAGGGVRGLDDCLVAGISGSPSSHNQLAHSTI
jgi:hypothetical protein